MVRLIEERCASSVFLTALGFGTGNLKDSKMEKLVDLVRKASVLQR